MISPPVQMEPMGAGQILKRTFYIYFHKFVHFIAIAALTQVPAGLLGIVSSQMMFDGYRMRGLEDPGTPGWGMLLAGLYMLALCVPGILSLLAHCLSTGALVKSVSEWYRGGDSTVAKAYRFVLPKSGWLVMAQILVALILAALIALPAFLLFLALSYLMHMLDFVAWLIAISLSLLLCLVPAAIFLVWFSVTTPAIVMENRNAFQGIRRSKALVRRNLGRSFLVNLVPLLISHAAAQFLQYPVAGLLGVLVFGERSRGADVFIQLGGMVAQTITSPIAATASILLYFDLRVRKEGFDLTPTTGSGASHQGFLRASC